MKLFGTDREVLPARVWTGFSVVLAGEALSVGRVQSVFVPPPSLPAAPEGTA